VWRSLKTSGMRTSIRTLKFFTFQIQWSDMLSSPLL
jgi:hypothetical protein